MQELRAGPLSTRLCLPVLSRPGHFQQASLPVRISAEGWSLSVLLSRQVGQRQRTRSLQVTHQEQAPREGQGGSGSPDYTTGPCRPRPSTRRLGRRVPSSRNACGGSVNHAAIFPAPDACSSRVPGLRGSLQAGRSGHHPLSGDTAFAASSARSRHGDSTASDQRPTGQAEGALGSVSHGVLSPSQPPHYTSSSGCRSHRSTFGSPRGRPSAILLAHRASQATGCTVPGRGAVLQSAPSRT